MNPLTTLVLGVAMTGVAHAAQTPDGGVDEAPQPRITSPFDETPSAAPDDAAPLELPRAVEGRWAQFFVDHQPNPEVLKKLDGKAIALADQAQQAYGANRFQEAYDKAVGALALEPDLPPSLLLLGTTAFRLRRHADARLAFERFLEVAPSELWRTQGLGHALYSLGDYPAARDHYRRVLEVLAESYEARRGLGLSLYRLGDGEGAVRELLAAIELRPTSYEAHAWLSEVLFDQGELDKARASAERAMELDAFDPRAYYTAFRVAFELGDDARADQMEARWRELTDYQAEVTALANRLLFEPDNVFLHFARMEAHARMQDQKALEAAAAELLSLPASGAEVLERGLRTIELLLRGGADSSARSLNQKLLELFPDDVRVQAYRVRFETRAE